MTAITKINFLTLLITCCSLMCKGQAYTDLKDQGYRGPVKIVVTKIYSDISYKNKRWVLNDSLHPNTVLSEYYISMPDLCIVAMSKAVVQKQSERNK